MMPTWLVVICSLAILCLSVVLTSKAQLENDTELEKIAWFVFIGGFIILTLIAQVTS